MSKMRRKPTARTPGFTLIELLVVIAIIVLLISMLVPALEKAMEMANRAKCGAHLKTIHLGLTNYHMSNKGEFIIARGRSVQISFAVKGVKGHDNDDADAEVDWMAALASVNLASEGLVEVEEEKAQQPPLEMWECPSRALLWQWNSNTGVFNVGYQHFGGIRTWRNPWVKGKKMESASPVRYTQSRGQWVLAADTTAKIENRWGGGTNAAFNRMPSHRGGSNGGPAGGNQVHVDGSAEWVNVDELVYVHSWSANFKRMFFIKSRDLNGMNTPDGAFAHNN